VFFSRTALSQDAWPLPNKVLLISNFLACSTLLCKAVSEACNGM